jgi:hypothetical protein
VYPIGFNSVRYRAGFGWAVRAIGFIALGTLGVALVLARPLDPRSRRQLP